MKIEKVVIPVAGLGTRLLPASRATPKVLLPLVDRPILHQAVEEAVACGISQVIIVTGRGQEALADYFTPAPELEARLGDRIRPLLELRERAELSYVLQEEPLGLGHAVGVARKAVGDEPFAVMLPDDVIVGEPPPMRRVLAAAQQREASVVAVEEVPLERIGAYGVILPRQVEPDLYRVLGLVEKPPVQEAPSDLAIVGRYVFTPQLFDALERTTPGALGELQLTDGIALLLEEQPVYACRLGGRRYDAGTPLGLLQTSVALALEREVMGPVLREWLRERLEE